MCVHVEATSALDLSTEEIMYRLLMSLNVTYLSVGHRPSLLKYHSLKLVLPGAGRDAQLSPVTVVDDSSTVEFAGLY